MTHVTGRRALLQSAAVALGGVTMPGIAGTTSSHAQTAKPHEFLVKDLVYSHSSGKDRLARFYQPAGTEPFPAVVQGHRGSRRNLTGAHPPIEGGATGDRPKLGGSLYPV